MNMELRRGIQGWGLGHSGFGPRLAPPPQAVKHDIPALVNRPCVRKQNFGEQGFAHKL